VLWIRYDKVGKRLKGLDMTGAPPDKGEKCEDHDGECPLWSEHSVKLSTIFRAT
jgi:hypothetical protein